MSTIPVRNTNKLLIMPSDWFNNLSPAEQAEYRRRNPRMGFWTRDFDDHPFINPRQQDLPPPHPLPQRQQQQQPLPLAPYPDHHNQVQAPQQNNYYRQPQAPQYPLRPGTPLPGTMGQPAYLPARGDTHTGYPALPQQAQRAPGRRPRKSYSSVSSRSLINPGSF